MTKKYDFSRIEKKWQKIWSQNNFKLWQGTDFSKKKKHYVLDMFPYPSGEGLHVGHVEGYTATDIYSRFLRLNNFNVLHPMGWDAFGLPTENYALKTKTHPEIITKKSVKKFKSQMQSLGFSYDWTREFSTTDPFYYKWTQWMFLKMFEKGLVFRQQAFINWCPSCKTSLAEEDLENGKCERCGSEIERKPLEQWSIKITQYAERLLNDLKYLNWPQNVVEMQKDWIGKSTGYEVKFKIITPQQDSLNQNDKETNLEVNVFTTRIDTIFGATYLVLAPEHPLVSKITAISNKSKVENYVNQVINKPELLRTKEKEITGVFTGSFGVNPSNNERIPIWISEYVLMNYATGAIMAVPAHDERDFKFAKKFDLEIREVISPDGQNHNLEEPYIGEGILINSGPFDRLKSTIAKDKIANFVGANKKVNYKIKDWVFARQRFWGEPIPLVFCSHCKQLIENTNLKIDEKFSKKDVQYKIGKYTYSKGEILNPGWIALKINKLPLTLPKVKYYKQTTTGKSPLAEIENWVETTCPKCSNPAIRETDTMPQWAGSSWYYLGYALGKNLKVKDFNKGWNKKVIDYWVPVDLYVGGVEHATRHLIYARFWHKFLYDLGLVSSLEPFERLVNQGLILGSDNEKMSKSKGNVINPDEIIKQYGADTLRIYEMFLGPLEAVKPWDTKSIIGVHRFLNRVWNLVIVNLTKNSFSKVSDKDIFKNLKINLHKTIKKVTEDTNNLKFNTAISALMELENELTINALKISKKDFKELMKAYLILLYPFAPHISSELFQILNPKKSIDNQVWPKFDAKLVKETEANYAIQVNGKLRATLTISKSLAQEKIIKKAQELKEVKKWLENKTIKKIIFIKDKIINFVINS